ncbi:MAG: Rieske 2Fe-2S domain-containing protein [Hyphomonadaceae bacterium]|nr:Rieske 2Fe-2S domain-containing protein [Hyphomonadaceae bacterium]
MNPARPKPGVALLPLAALAELDARAVDFREGDWLFSVIVVRRGAAVTAFVNWCPHAGAPLERPDGRVVIEDGRYLVCSAHGACFAVEDGACAGGPSKRGLVAFPVAVENGVVIVA